MNLKDISWWLWVPTLAGLYYGLLADPAGFRWAISATLVNLFYYILVDKKASSFSVQVRFVMLLILLSGYAEGLGWIYWIPATGLTVRLLTGYCLLARLLSLLPWNRSEPFSMSLLKRRIFSPPTQGSILKT